MPKQRRSRSLSFERRYHTLPYPSSSSSRNPHPASSSGNPADSVELTKNAEEWEDVRCPVCMEYPHNAVLLQCSSYDKGCRPFMCDTSYRHSNCLDQYRKAFSELKSQNNVDATEQLTNMVCPLCRGLVTGWTAIESARRYMNAKSRSCSTESCPFSGAYGELRKHARKEHPSARPSEADPERQQDWMRMEQQRDMGDLFSMLHSAIAEQDGVHVNEDGQETSGSTFVFPSMSMLLVVHVRRAGGNDIGLPFWAWLSSSRRSARDMPRRQRGRRVIGLGNTLSTSVSTHSRTHQGNNDDQSNGGDGSDEVDTTFHDNE